MYELSSERIALDIDLKLGDLRQIQFFQEWDILKDYQDQDKVLEGNLDLRFKEREQICNQLLDTKDRLEEKRDEIENILSVQKDLSEQFHNVIGENNRHEEVLSKVFKRKAIRKVWYINDISALLNQHPMSRK